MIHQTSPTTWQVPSRTHVHLSYEVRRYGRSGWACQCKRNSLGRKECAHIRMVRDCPDCQGQGSITLNLRWLEADCQEAPRTLACVTCSGTGLREPQPASDLPSEAECRRIFA